MPFYFTSFGTTIVKSYLVDNDNTKNNFLFITEILPIVQNLLPNSPPLLATENFAIVTGRSS